MATLTLTERDFETRADEELKQLANALDQVDDLEADLQMGVLTITFGDGARYIVNSHRAAKQIWGAAERSAWHFDPQDDGRWVAPKNGDELWSTVSRLLSSKLRRPVALRG
ncbi:MAG: iron donor protein CyaY [Polyangiaceae bacterium]|nr:iron donor protein CyaY [Polyangiaceae bacterium]